MKHTLKTKGQPTRQMHKETVKTEENKRKYLFLYHRYLYIYAFVHKCLIILYIRLFSYWKKKELYSCTPTLTTSLRTVVPCCDAVCISRGGKWDVILHVKVISQGTFFISAGDSSQFSTSCRDPPHSSCHSSQISSILNVWTFLGTLALCPTETKGPFKTSLMQ